MKEYLDEVKEILNELVSDFKEGNKIIQDKRRMALEKLLNYGSIKHALMGFGVLGGGMLSYGLKMDSNRWIIQGGAFLLIDSVYAIGFYGIPYLTNKIRHIKDKSQKNK